MLGEKYHLPAKKILLILLVFTIIKAKAYANLQLDLETGETGNLAIPLVT